MSRSKRDAARILYIAPSLPYPLNTGMALRGYHLLRAYSTAGVVKLVCFAEQGEDVEPLHEYCEAIHTVPRATISRRGHGSGWRARLEMAGTLTPALAGRFQSNQMGHIVEQLVDWADLVHVAKLWMLPNARLPRRGNGARGGTILDLDDVETVVQRRSFIANRPTRWQRRIFERFDLLRLWRYQRKALNTFDRVFVCSDRDYRSLGLRNVIVIPNGASVPAAPLPEQTDGRTLLYVGNLSYQPNVDGVVFLVKNVLPLIRLDVPDVRLLIAGRKPSEEVLALEDDRQIRVFGDPPTIEPYYRQATASVVSLRIGGGTRLRILEALALGRPVVSTSIGCEGLDVKDGEHLLVADDAPGLAKACVALLRDPALRRRLAARGRELVEQKYTWHSIEERVRFAAADLLAGREK